MEWSRIPGHRPAVEPERRGVEQQAMDAVGAIIGKMGGQNAAHGKAARDDDVAIGTQPVVRGLHALVPLPPGGAPQLFRGPAMTGELTTMHGVAGVRERVGDEAKLDGRAAEAVYQQ